MFLDSWCAGSNAVINNMNSTFYSLWIIKRHLLFFHLQHIYFEQSMTCMSIIASINIDTLHNIELEDFALPYKDPNT